MEENKDYSVVTRYYKDVVKEEFKKDYNDELYTTEVFDQKGRTIAFKYHKPDELVRTYYLEGKVLYDEDGDIDIAYKDTSYILFYFKNGNLIKIDVAFDVDDPYISVEKFVQEWQELLPFMTSKILEYFTNPEPLLPNIGI